MVRPSAPPDSAPPAGAQVTEAGGPVPPSLVIALRHGEKPADAEHEGAALDQAGPGLDTHGQRNRSSLTLRGWQRSGALAGTRVCGLLTPPTAPITILVPRYRHTKHHRSYQTMRALADRLATPVEDRCGAGDVDGLERHVLQADGIVVVCWEHDPLVALARRLSTTAPEAWPEGRFDVLWLLRRTVNDEFDFEQRWQNLLVGDTVPA
jgi:hypothetical protein